MSIQRSHAHLSIIIAGHRMVVTRMKISPTSSSGPRCGTASSARTAATTRAAVPDFGCKITIRLSDMSPSIQWAIQQRTLHLNAVRDGAPVPVLEGSITDLSFGISGTFEGMTIDDTFPGWPGAAASTNEIMFDCERFTPSVDGGAFQAPLTVVAT